MIEDLGSSNGTILITRTNEPLRLAKNQPHVLAHGDKLRLGDTTLHFVVN
jgi:pSer/pThr/pTyr-binding forkhead associated (FHA) protein